MTFDHDTFARRLDHLDDLDDLERDLAEHAAGCNRCRARLELARRIRTTAPDLVPAVAGDDNITDAVLHRTHPSVSRLPRLLAVAAAVVAIVATGLIVVLDRPGAQPDVLADIADDYADSPGLRFVYATQASVDVVTEFDLDATRSGEVEALGAQIPSCTNDTTTDTDPGGGPTDGQLDLAPIAEALASNDPCLALQLIAESAGPARDAYSALATSISESEATIDQIDTADPDSALAAATADAFIDDQQQQIDRAQQTLENLETSFTTLAETVQPLATTTDTPTFGAAAVEGDLTALRNDTIDAEQSTPSADPVVEWTQIATGTWSPDNIAIEGITERDDASIPYSSISDDPLGLADTVFATPGVLLDLLRSAPTSDSDETEWQVPDGVLQGSLDWTATARLGDNRLFEIRLESADTTITFTPQR